MSGPFANLSQKYLLIFLSSKTSLYKSFSQTPLYIPLFQSIPLRITLPIPSLYHTHSKLLYQSPSHPNHQSIPLQITLPIPSLHPSHSKLLYQSPSHPPLPKHPFTNLHTYPLAQGILCQSPSQFPPTTPSAVESPWPAYPTNISASPLQPPLSYLLPCSPGNISQS